MKTLIAAVVASLIQSSLAATAAEWRGRTIYQVFTDRFARTDGSIDSPCDVTKTTYCGGTWAGLTSKLDYIKNMGFTAVWISPITAQTPNGYHGYYQTDLYSTNPYFGTPSDLNALSAALHARGMYLMVDVVPNHMGFPGCPDQVDYLTLGSMDQASKFHPHCPIVDYQNQTQLEQCWLGDCLTSMPDLKTDSPEVAAELNSWIKGLVANYSVDGLRIDSVKNVNKDFFPTWCEAAGVFCMGEVSEGEPTYTYPYQEYVESIFDYPLYYSMTRVFQQKTNMSDIVVALASCTDNAQTGCKDSTLLGTFLENHDNPRFAAGTSDMSLVKNAMAFAMLGDGIPVVYQGQEQHYNGGDDPGCREAIWFSEYNTTSPLYGHTALLNLIRNHVSAHSNTYLTYQTRVVSYSASIIQLRKDVVRTVLTNQGSGAGSSVFKTQGMQFSSGTTVVDLFSCNKYIADGNGEVEISMNAGMPFVLVEEGDVGGIGVCGL